MTELNYGPTSITFLENDYFVEDFDKTKKELATHVYTLSQVAFTLPDATSDVVINRRPIDRGSVLLKFFDEAEECIACLVSHTHETNIDVPSGAKTGEMKLCKTKEATEELYKFGGTEIKDCIVWQPKVASQKK